MLRVPTVSKICSESTSSLKKSGETLLEQKNIFLTCTFYKHKEVHDLSKT